MGLQSIFSKLRLGFDGVLWEVWVVSFLLKDDWVLETTADTLTKGRDGQDDTGLQAQGLGAMGFSFAAGAVGVMIDWWGNNNRGELLTIFIILPPCTRGAGPPVDMMGTPGREDVTYVNWELSVTGETSWIAPGPGLPHWRNTTFCPMGLFFSSPWTCTVTICGWLVRVLSKWDGKGGVQDGGCLWFSVEAFCKDTFCSSCITTQVSDAENPASFPASGSFETFSVPALAASLVDKSLILGSSSSMMLTVTVPCLSTPSTMTSSLQERSLLICSSSAISGSIVILSTWHSVFKPDSFSDTLLSILLLALDCDNTITEYSLLLTRGKFKLLLFSWLITVWVELNTALELGVTTFFLSLSTLVPSQLLILLPLLFLLLLLLLLLL